PTTFSPGAKPGFELSTAVWLPLTASLARFLGWVNLNQSVPTTMGVALVPTGIFNLVRVGPMPRRTTPLVIPIVPPILKSPEDSCTTWPTGHASNAAWMPARASAVPLPYVDAFTVAQRVVRAGTPPGTPGFQT